MGGSYEGEDIAAGKPDSPGCRTIIGAKLISRQAYKHIFTSPSSVDGENRATRSGNAQIHGMTSVTVPSLVYVATLVRTGPVWNEPFRN